MNPVQKLFAGIISPSYIVCENTGTALTRNSRSRSLFI
jgi:hypothetical protein